MKLEQKNLLETLFNLLKEDDEICKACITFEVEKNEMNNWEIILYEKSIEDIKVFVFFVDIAQMIQTCEQIYSAPDERLTYGFQLIEQDEQVLLRYVIY